MIYEDAKGKKLTEVVTTLPDESYLSKPNPEFFSGTVLVEDWKGNFIKGYSYNGGIVEPINSITEFQKRANAAYETEWICKTMDWYSCTDAGGCSYLYSETTCIARDGGDYSPNSGSPTPWDYPDPAHGGSEEDRVAVAQEVVINHFFLPWRLNQMHL